MPATLKRHRRSKGIPSSQNAGHSISRAQTARNAPADGWKLSLHISYILITKPTEIEIAAAVKAMVKSNNAKEAAEVLKAELYREVKEFRGEDAQIKRALAEFNIYLKKGVKVTYNDT